LSINLSFWEKNSFFAPADAVIIGGGIVGLSAAISLKKEHPNWRIVVIERGNLPSGASTKNAGFACFGSITELIDDLENGMSQTDLISLIKKRYEGLQYLRGLLSDSGVGYEHCGGYEVFQDEISYQKAIGFIPQINEWLRIELGLEDVYQPVSDTTKFGFAHCEGMIFNRAEGSIDTGRMMVSLQSLAHYLEIQLITGIGVSNIEDKNNQVLLSLSNEITMIAQKVIVCTNGFAKQLLPTLAVNPARNQVLITKPIDGLKINSCFHYDGGYVYFRNIGNRILLGGFRNLAKEEESTADFGNTTIIQAALTAFLKEFILPNQQVEIDYWWSGILGLGTEKKPIIEMASTNVAVAVRMGGMGVAIGAQVGVEGAGLLR
jgi:gamma-glutamylputrescine oxidase